MGVRHEGKKVTHERLAVRREDRAGGREELGVEHVVVQEADPRVEEEVEGHAADPACIHLPRRDVGDVSRDGGLHADEREALFVREQRLLDEQAAVLGLAVGQARDVRAQELAERRPGVTERVEAVGQLASDLREHRAHEVLARRKMDEDRAVRDARLAGDIGRAQRERPAHDDVAPRDFHNSPASLCFLGGPRRHGERSLSERLLSTMALALRQGDASDFPPRGRAGATSPTRRLRVKTYRAEEIVSRAKDPNVVFVDVRDEPELRETGQVAGAGFPVGPVDLVVRKARHIIPLHAGLRASRSARASTVSAMPNDPVQNRPRRHHTVPRFYLERFAVDGRIIAAKRDDLTDVRSFGTRDVTIGSHFYTLELEEGRSPELEQFFANVIEPAGASAIRRIVDDGFFPPPPGRRSALAMYCAFQFVRGHAVRHALLEHYDAVAKEFASLITPEQAREVLAEDGKEPTSAEIDDFLKWARDTNNYTVRATMPGPETRAGSGEANLHAQTILPTVMDLIPFFEQRAWHLLTFEDDTLVTGDEPIVLATESGEPGEQALGLGIAEQVFFVTDPRHAIGMIRPDLSKEDRTHKGTPGLARMINRNLAYGCHRWVLHKPGTNPLDGLDVPKKGAVVESEGDLVKIMIRPKRAS